MSFLSPTPFEILPSALSSSVNRDGIGLGETINLTSRLSPRSLNSLDADSSVSINSEAIASLVNGVTSERDTTGSPPDLSSQSSNHFDNPSSNSHHTIMCVHAPSRNKQVGVCIYDLVTRDLSTGLVQWNSWGTFNRFKQQFGVASIITSAEPKDEIFDILKYNSSNLNSPYHVITIPRAEFALDIAIKRIQSVRVEEIQGHEADFQMNRRDQTLMLRGALDFQQSQTLCVLGGLIYHLRHTRENYEISIARFHKLNFEHLLATDEETRVSLSIFRAEQHPGKVIPALSNSEPESRYFVRGGKEGFSVYSVYDQCKMRRGSRLLRRWLSEPLVHISEISQRQDLIEFFCIPDNKELLIEVRSALGQIRDLTSLTYRAQRKPLLLKDWKAIQNSLRSFTIIAKALSSAQTHLPLLREIVENYPMELYSLSSTIDQVLDLNSDLAYSLNDAMPRVRDHINPELDTLRNKYLRLDEYLASVAAAEIEQKGMSPEEAQHFSILYLPQLGFLAKFEISKPPNSSRDTFEAPFEIPGYEFQFQTEAQAFFKSKSTELLDDEFGDIESSIRDLESAIVRDLLELLLANKSPIFQYESKMTILDCITSASIVAQNLKLVRPQMTKEQVLDITGGRHLLHERMVSNFIANPCHINCHGSGRVHLLTGPNCSGKSIYLKQVGIIVYLAHCGLFVPAEEAIVGVCDALYTRIKTFDSINANFSSFTNDTSQLAYLLRSITSQSLILVDEYGRGTASLDGISLVAGIVQSLSRDVHCPRLIFTTHMHELFSLNIIRESNVISFWRMKYLSRLGVADEIIYLYEIERGVTEASLGLACAEKEGVPKSIIDRAHQISQHVSKGVEIAPIQANFIFEMEPRRGKNFNAFMAFVSKKLGLNSPLEYDLGKSPTETERLSLKNLKGKISRAQFEQYFEEYSKL